MYLQRMLAMALTSKMQLFRHFSLVSEMIHPAISIRNLNIACFERAHVVLFW